MGKQINIYSSGARGRMRYPELRFGSYPSRIAHESDGLKCWRAAQVPRYDRGELITSFYSEIELQGDGGSIACRRDTELELTCGHRWYQASRCEVDTPSQRQCFVLCCNS